MDGEPLSTLRRRIDRLAAGGEYVVVCARTGTRPVPVEGVRFPDWESATTAARLATAYRARLRGYDPRAREHDFVVCTVTDLCRAGGEETPTEGSA